MNFVKIDLDLQMELLSMRNVTMMKPDEAEGRKLDK